MSHWEHLEGTRFASTYAGIVARFLDAKAPHLAESRASRGWLPGQQLIPDLSAIPFPPPKNPKYSFIDLFAGIGGFRLAMQGVGGVCVFSSEWNASAQRTYLANYGELPFGDITRSETKAMIPEGFDVLCAGFPCQPFSRAGVSARVSLNRATGFGDKTQGTLFFDVVAKEQDPCPTQDPALIRKRMELSKYKCEYNSNHKLFVSRATGTQYVEVHHIIPRQFQPQFWIENRKDLTKLDNLCSLCPWCHRAVHHAVEEVSRSILSNLYDLRSLGFHYGITKEQLFQLYSVEEIVREDLF